jgi:hydroxyethylthiazole kinase
MRCNAAELEALIGGQADESRRCGIRPRAALRGADRWFDLVTDGARLRRISNGHPLMGRITAMGCAATALMAGFLAVADDPLEAALACLVTVGIGRRGSPGRSATGPGSFVPAYLDALFAFSPDELAARARIA